MDEVEDKAEALAERHNFDGGATAHGSTAVPPGQQTSTTGSLLDEPNDESGEKSLSEKLADMRLAGGPRARTPVSQVKELPASPPAPKPPADREKPYLDPTPKTPAMSRRPSNQSTGGGELVEKSEELENDVSKEKGPLKLSLETDQESTMEIQNIMDQFTTGNEGLTKEQIMSPREELAGPLLGFPEQFPPRKSSLEPLRSRDMDSIASSPVTQKSEKFPQSPPPVPPKPEQPLVMSSSPSVPSLPKQPPPPEPEPEPDLPFDFHRFLEQLRHKSADPVAKFLRSFLNEFGKKQWMVHEQVKIIGDFLAFITNKMALCDVWREVSDAEFDNAKEGMEKLVMNRLYSQTFSPAIPPAIQPPRAKGKRREPEKFQGPGRRGQHQEDVERDDILAQKIRIYSWIREEHLDIPPVGASSERFLKLAQQELSKIKNYRAPRDKVICVLNCCKVIFGLLKNSKTSDLSADSFVPLLIYVVLHANPDHLVSNVQYILRFRNQDKLGGESGYYLSSLSGAIQFIESLDRTTLTVSDEEFERNVELAVSAIAEQNREAENARPRKQQLPEKSALAEPELTPRNSVDASSSSPGRPGREGHPTGLSSESTTDENAAVAGLLKTIQRPLSTLGRIFSDQDTPSARQSETSTDAAPSLPPRFSPSVFQPPRDGAEEQRSHAQTGPGTSGSEPGHPIQSVDAQEAAARQASAEAAEARRIQRAEHKNVVETLYGMFPNLDKEVIDDVVRSKEGRVGLAVDACLALTAEG